MNVVVILRSIILPHVWLRETKRGQIEVRIQKMPKPGT